MKRGPGARSGRRDYSGLPRFEVFWDFPGGGYCCPGCGEPFSLLGDHWSGEQLDWQVIIRLVANCQRRYRRACRCRGPATVMAPGPPKAIGKGLFTNGFIAMLLVERFEAGRSANSLATGLARQGAEISPATLAGTVAQAGGLLVPVEEAIAARNRDSWHLHADETSWRVFSPATADGPAKFWLWVFIGADTVCFVMDPARSGEVLARHAGMDEDTGQLTRGEDGGPRRLVISTDFYAVYESAGKKAGGWSISTACACPEVLRPGGRREPGSAAVLGAGVAGPVPGPVPRPRRTGGRLAGGRRPAPGRKQQPRNGWRRLGMGRRDRRDRRERKKQAQAPGLQEPAKKALATLGREWDGLIAHRDYPMIGLDNYPDAAVMPMSAGSGGPAAGQGGALAA